MKRFAQGARLSALTGAAAVLALGLTACGGGVSDTATDEGSAESSTATEFTPATSGEMTLYTWSDYFPEDLAKKFESDTGIKLTVDYYDSNESLEAKLRASNGAGYDVVVPTDYMVEILKNDGLLKEFDSSILPNSANIEDDFLNPYFDEGRKYTVPYLYGTTGFAYDTSVVSGDDAPTSWKDYFTMTALGKVGTMNDQNEVINAALRAVGGTTCSTDATQLQAAQDLLMGFKDNVSTINSDGILDRMVAGEEKMAMIWNGAALRAMQENTNLEYVYPEEGMALWQDSFAIPSGAENVDQALTFLNWMMEPENAAEAANFQKYNSGITGVADLLGDDMKNSSAIVIPEGYTGAQPVEPCTNEELSNYSKIWEAFKG